MMYTARSDDGFISAIPGVSQKTLVYGEKSLMTEFHLTKNYVIPGHAHPHEQAGYLISGRLRLRVGTEIFDISPGDSWCIPGGVTHGADILADSVAIEVFTPVREDYLPQSPR